jgi:hypothetical protein
MRPGGECRTLIWMDTLCVPVKDEDAHWRAAAINDMAAIYAEAYARFVLDKYLDMNKMKSENYEISTSSSRQEDVARVACSAWMSRSWTLQEAILGLDWHISRGDRSQCLSAIAMFPYIADETDIVYERTDPYQHPGPQHPAWTCIPCSATFTTPRHKRR